MSQTRMEFAYTTLRDKVCAGELSPGQRLVNRTLGKELGVSTVTVREALHRLTSEGLVEHIPNAGAFVRRLDRKEMVDQLLLRSNLDCFVAEQAVLKIEKHHLRLLEAICSEWRKVIVGLRGLPVPDQKISGEQLSHWLDLDVRFHSLLVEAVDNSWLTKMIDDLDLNTRAMRSIHATSPSLSFSEAVLTYRHHASITKALKKRDVEVARHWMGIHGKASISSLLKHIDDASLLTI